MKTWSKLQAFTQNRIELVTRPEHDQLMEPLDLNDPNLVKAIWKPEVYFPNAKDAEFQYVTVPNVLVRIDPGGQILYMLR